jgi:glutathione S-transferase
MQVPVLANAAVLGTPIADSLEITWYIADRYPSLPPAEHKEDIDRLLRDLHPLHYFSLSFEGKPHVPASIRAAVVQPMENPEISQRHRDALAYKLTMLVLSPPGASVHYTQHRAQKYRQS